MSVSKYRYTSQSTVTLPYSNLTWLLSSFGVKLDNVVKPGHHGFAAKVDSLQ